MNEPSLIVIDPVSTLLLILVVGIAAAVLPYAHRSLRGDRRGREVTVAIAAMLAATAVVSIAGELWMLALAWSAATAATLAALGLGGGRPALARAAGWLVAGDLALWSAVIVDSLGAGADTVALLLVIAALLRCALPPAHPWLIDSLHAPTPVSAALHGGIVNGGGILVITQIDLIAPSTPAVVLLATGGAVAIVTGVIAALVRTDVKGRLVMSTVAQMGFMLLVAALGLVAAALLHLVAHGFYKSALFLSSSDGIDRRAADRRAPRVAVSSAAAQALRAGFGAAIPMSALVLAAVAVYPGGRGLPELILLVAISAAFAAAGSRVTRLVPGTARALVVALATAGAAVVFVLATSALTAALGEGSTTGTATGTAVAVALAAIVIVVLLTIAAARRWAPAGTLALRLLALGHRIGARPVRRHRSRPRTHRGPDARTAPARASQPDTPADHTPMGAPA